ncbi:MAG: Hpt domain-containing protein, partial [Clostridiales Family XIII bacterium]|nr:Hpt domain-containing protein [Clostridiales Family XIII bacterium]
MYNESDNDSLLELYMFEATTLLDRLDGALARIRENGAFSRAEDADVKRIMETLKGSSDLMRFDLISDIAFETERMLETVSAISLGETDAARLADLMARIAAVIRADLDRRENGKPETERPDELFAEIAGFSETLDAGNAAKSLAAEPKGQVRIPPGPEKTPAEQSEPALSRYILHLYFYEDSRMENVRAYLLTDRLSKKGNISAAYPPDIENDTEASEYIRENGYYIALDTTMLREQLEAMLKGTLSVESVSFTASMPESDAENLPERAAVPAKPVSAPVAAKPVITEQKSVIAEAELPAMSNVTAELAGIPHFTTTEQKPVTVTAEAELPITSAVPDPVITEQKSVSAESSDNPHFSIIGQQPAIAEAESPAPVVITEQKSAPEPPKKYAEGANVECIKISLGGELYSLPISCVRESFAAESGQGTSVTHRGKAYPLIEIGSILGVKNAVRAVNDGVLLLVSADEKQGCLLADSIIGT